MAKEGKLKNTRDKIPFQTTFGLHPFADKNTDMF